MKQILLYSLNSETMLADKILVGDKQNIFAIINDSYCYIRQINKSFYWYLTETNQKASDLHGDSARQLVEYTLIQNIATSVLYLTDEEIIKANKE